ncbi:MAG TPA: hypothetical protein VKP30_29175 [Polyangiaceae bacterium]|nr:hypothetical protein [Polyangiaceae bacterium]
MSPSLGNVERLDSTPLTWDTPWDTTDPGVTSTLQGNRIVIDVTQSVRKQLGPHVTRSVGWVLAAEDAHTTVVGSKESATVAAPRLIKRETFTDADTRSLDDVSES